MTFSKENDYLIAKLLTWNLYPEQYVTAMEVLIMCSVKVTNHALGSTHGSSLEVQLQSTKF